ncbi:RES domain-containing protein [Thalassospira sp. NFXS8]|uniref:RES family NAD+ phosphorylase n=1 Tax=Thalassospira sp. NFXS8 TaxID=2819093 RepID=UPI0032E01F11
MTHRLLPAVRYGYRIGDPTGIYPVYSADGARLFAGRWNDVGQPVIYCSEHYSTAMLEKLVHFNGEVPNGQHFVKIIFPAGISYEVFSAAHHSDWHAENEQTARQFGSKWFHEKRSCILLVPSIVARDEHNILINTLHPDFSQITTGLEQPIWWDDRLYQ